MRQDATVDLLIIGGGVNGSGIARDAAGRGLSVMLCEQGDLAGATSSASSKLIHGGLRYLEYYQFRFVREALKEREVLLGIAPHIIWPARFVLPHDKQLRPAFLIQIGLFLYDWLAPSRRLPGSRRLKLKGSVEGAPLQERLTTGFVYADCRVDDARLVALNAIDAGERGAEICPRTRCISAWREKGLWRADMLQTRDAMQFQVSARALVNAAGPWAAKMTETLGGLPERETLRLVKGSHIIVPRMFQGEHCYILQNIDGRVIFVMPYESSFTLIGTTEIAFAGDPSTAKIDAEEVSYLCEAVSRYFRRPLAPSDVVESFCGVRPLYDDKASNASAASRDYVLDLDAPPGSAPLVSVLGGKITSHRKLSEDVVDRLLPYLDPPRAKPWTATAPLPGGDMEGGDFDRFLRTLRAKFRWLDEGMLVRIARAYGTRAELILKDARNLSDLGEDFGAGLYQAEIDYLIDREFALTGEDVLWRRSKLRLHMSPSQIALVAAYVDARVRAREYPNV